LIAKPRTRDEVEAILAECRASDQPQRKFAETIGIRPSTLAFWIRREKLEAAKTSAIVAVGPRPAPPRAVGFELEAFGLKLTLPRDVTVEELRRVREAWTQ